MFLWVDFAHGAYGGWFCSSESESDEHMLVVMKHVEGAWTE